MDRIEKREFRVKNVINNINRPKFSKYTNVSGTSKVSNYDYIYMYDRKGRLTFASFGGAHALGLKPNEVVGKTWTDLGLPSETIKAFNLQLEVVFKTGRPLIGENKFPTIYGEKDIEYILYPLKSGNGFIDAVECTVKDITERKLEEEEIKKKMMKYRFEDGRIYIVKESQLSKSIQAFKELLKFGYKGLIISRTPEKDFKRIDIDRNYEFIWLADNYNDKNKYNFISTKFNEIRNKVENLGNRNAILIERIDYLISKNGFKKTLEFIQLINDIAYVMNDIVIISIDPIILNDKELRLLEKECRELTTRVNKDKLPLKTLGVLKSVYQDNIKGIKPSYTDLGQELQMSKPTVRKIVRSLISKGHITEIVKGRNKNIQITDIGRDILLD